MLALVALRIKGSETASTVIMTGFAKVVVWIPIETILTLCEAQILIIVVMVISSSSNIPTSGAVCG